jgi:phosphate:Na+ symporter
LDHLSELNDDLKRIPPVVINGQPRAGFEAGAQALSTWLDATKDPNEAPALAIFKALEAASKRLNEERKTGRARVLEDTALQRTPMATARAALETLAWADLTMYHSWRLTESLRIASAR